MFDILIFLYAHNFFNKANYIIVVMLIFCYYKMNFNFQRITNSTFYALLLGSLTYCGIFIRNYGFPEISTFSLRFVAPIVMMYLGIYIGKKDFEYVRRTILCIAFAGSIHGVLNVYNNRGVDILAIAGRQYRDIYGGVVSGTLQNLYFIVSSSLLFYFMVYIRDKRLRVMGVIVGFSGIIASIINASRTMIYLTILMFLLSLFIYLYMNYGLGSAVVRYISLAILGASVVVCVLWLDLFGVQEIFANSALGRRGSHEGSSVSDNLRWKYAGDILKLLPYYPMGKIEYEHYAHNLWVDIAKETGIIPFVLYIVFSIKSIKELFLYLRNKVNRIEEKVLFFSVVSSYTIVFFTEPIMVGAPIAFSLFAYVIGCMLSLNHRD